MPEPEELRPHVTGQRRRWLGIGLAGVLAVQLAATAILVLREPRRDVVHTTTSSTVIMMPTPVIVTVESPAAQVPLARTSCPPARTDAPHLVPPELGEPIDHVHVAPTNAGWVAAWNTEHVFVSRDAGASFRRVLDGPGDVRDVAFDCYGHALALRADRVGILDAGAEQWHRVPDIGVSLHGSDDRPGDGTDPDDLPLAAALAGGGPDVVVIGHGSSNRWRERLSVSSDLGHTWRHRDLSSWGEAQGDAGARQDPDGLIHVAFTLPDCMSAGLWWATVRGDTLATDIDTGNGGPERVVLTGDIALSPYQWRTLHGQWHPITGLSDDDSYPDVIPGAFATLAGAEAVYRISDGKARKLTVVASGTLQTVDRAGRIWTVVCGRPAILGREALVRDCGPDI